MLWPVVLTFLAASFVAVGKRLKMQLAVRQSRAQLAVARNLVVAVSGRNFVEKTVLGPVTPKPCVDNMGTTVHVKVVAAVRLDFAGLVRISVELDAKAIVMLYRPELNVVLMEM
ncbi:hypothetical protein K7432_014482 [Basidiobolus ranarum]|uniref:Secreted protein n=1 Tax=Basidiobolus ranarum TaxID=34480 RepID=A0ABR2WHQ5_9FUNG